jgi:hypothetical protein
LHENVRHLVLTAYAHMKFMGLPGWGELGLGALAIPHRSKLVGDPGTPMADLLAAWETVNLAALSAFSDAVEPKWLHQHLRHQQQHTKEIGRLLRAFDRQQRSTA